MSGRFVLISGLALSLAACGAAADAGVAPCVPLGPAAPTGPGADATAWLNAHNLVRSGCGVTISPAPAPALPLLEWSSAAAAVAQAWADGCVDQHNPGRGNRGENIAASSPGHWDPAGVVGAWAGEWSSYRHAPNACASGQVCGHYTQLVWRGTLRVGCASRRCTTGSPFPGLTAWDFHVCNYEPPGNVRGQRPY